MSVCSAAGPDTAAAWHVCANAVGREYVVVCGVVTFSHRLLFSGQTELQHQGRVINDG